MLYQQALKQLNTIFPKLDIKTPNKKATVRSLIQGKDCPSLTNSDFKLLQNTETCSKPLNKLAKTLRTWLAILQQNQKARQQQENKPVSRKALDHLQFMMADCGQIQGKSDFVMYIREHGGQVYGNSPITSSTKEYKEVYICNEVQFYNTITRIDQDQYFRQLEELTEKLGVFEQFCENAATSMEDLEQFLEVLSKDELFKKKDNSLNRVINYNLMRAIDLMYQIQKIQKMVYYYKENLTFSLARCYYLCFQSYEEIRLNKKDRKKLEEIKHFVCDRQEKVFTKLYARKIAKALIKLEQIQSEFLMSPFEKESEVLENMRYHVQKYQFLKSKFDALIKPINEAQFIDFYGEIQNILANFKLQNEDGMELRLKIIKLEQEIVVAFVNETNTGRRYLDIGSARNSVSTVKFGRQSSILDSGEDIFIKPISYQETEAFKQRIDTICQRKEQIPNICKTLLGRVNGQIGDHLEDDKNIEMQEVMVLLEAAKSLGMSCKEIQELDVLVKNMIRNELSEQTVSKIFQPTFRLSVLISLRQKLIQHSYKLTRAINSSQFGNYPQNLKDFALKRQSFVKNCQRQIDLVISLAQIINARVKQKSQYDICQEETYKSFVKVLIAKKQTKAYEMAYRDVKEMSKNAKKFIQDKVYTPFGMYLNSILPEKAKSIVEDLDQIEFFVDFYLQTGNIIQDFTEAIEQDPDTESSQREELARILTKWSNEVENKLRNRKSYFTYDKAEQQLDKVQQVIQVCKGDNPAQLKYAQSKALVSALR